MNREEIIAYIVESVRHTRFGTDMEDEDMVPLCRAIGSMSPETIRAIVNLDDDLSPGQVVEALEGHQVAWPVVKELKSGEIGVGLGIEAPRANIDRGREIGDFICNLLHSIYVTNRASMAKLSAEEGVPIESLAAAALAQAMGDSGYLTSAAPPSSSTNARTSMAKFLKHIEDGRTSFINLDQVTRILPGFARDYIDDGQGRKIMRDSDRPCLRLFLVRESIKFSENEFEAAVVISDPAEIEELRSLLA